MLSLFQKCHQWCQSQDFVNFTRPHYLYYPWEDPNKGIPALVKFSLTYTCSLLFKSPRHQNVCVNEPERWKSNQEQYDDRASYLSTQFLRQVSAFPSSRLLGFPNGSMQVCWCIFLECVKLFPTNIKEALPPSTSRSVDGSQSEEVHIIWEYFQESQCMY